MQRIMIDQSMMFDALRAVDVSAPTLVRRSQMSGSHPADLTRIDVRLGRETRSVIIHDVHDVGWWADVKGGVLYNALVYNIGWQSAAPDNPRARTGGGHGHPLYCQNDGTAPRLIDSCVLAAGMAGTTGKIYAERTNTCRAVHLRQTILIGARFLAGGVRHGADDITVNGCAMLGGVIQMGYYAQNKRGGVTDCLIDGGVTVANREIARPSWDNFTFVGNTLIGGDSDRVVNINGLGTGWAWDNNTYYTRRANGRIFAINGAGWFDLAGWRARTGYDLNSTVIFGDPPPSVRIYPVADADSHLANIAVSSPGGDATVDIDLSATGAERGRLYVLKNALDPAAEGQRFVYHDAPVRVQMSGLGTAPAANWTAQTPPPGLPRNPYPRFGVFRLEQSKL